MSEPMFSRVIEQGLALQSLLTGLKLVVIGGTAAALHCEHRYSLDVDCVSPFLAERYSKVSEALAAWDGWTLLRQNPPDFILGERCGVELAVRQSRRSAPLQTTTVKGISVPTLCEMLRIKAFLMVQRRATRDYVDFAALSSKLPENTALRALAYLNCVYGGGIQTIVTCFAEACEGQPLDLQAVPLGSYRGLRSPYTHWSFVAEVCRRFGRQLIKQELNHKLPGELDAGFFEGPIE
ncbi:MAG: hypothetical protein HY735_16525 [Verrucomicrobia bacterium]|nr:hypothetical protein [Verrucomicrobiota bacterium]